MRGLGKLSSLPMQISSRTTTLPSRSKRNWRRSLSLTYMIKLCQRHLTINTTKIKMRTYKLTQTLMSTYCRTKTMSPVLTGILIKRLSSSWRVRWRRSCSKMGLTSGSYAMSASNRLKKVTLGLTAANATTSVSARSATKRTPNMCISSLNTK